MRTIKLGTADACITMFNAIGHISKNDFKQTIQNVFHNLKDDGIYVFDIFNLNAINDGVIRKFAYQSHKIVKDIQILKTQVSCLDKNNGLLISYDNYTIQKNAEKPQIFVNEFTLQIYTMNELKHMLTENGFTNIMIYGLDGKEFIEDRTISMLIVAQK
jgi:hypothetical protein